MPRLPDVREEERDGTRGNARARHSAQSHGDPHANAMAPDSRSTVVWLFDDERPGNVSSGFSGARLPWLALSLFPASSPSGRAAGAPSVAFPSALHGLGGVARRAIRGPPRVAALPRRRFVAASSPSVARLSANRAAKPPPLLNALAAKQSRQCPRRFAAIQRRSAGQAPPAATRRSLPPWTRLAPSPDRPRGGRGGLRV
jgi:hypothetical protein